MSKPAYGSNPTHPQLLSRLMKGVAEDVKAYRHLQALLEDQFNAALRYQAARLNELAGQITGTVDALEQRRQQRVFLVENLLGAGGTMARAFPMLTGNAREALESGWQLLEDLVVDCKQRNVRNCNLMMDQQNIMQKVLHGEEQIYAPG
ncbi:flagellar export chaperone FlgN [Undibacterium sp.]|jgi:flagella synthesis protein FlgN|uniref:flagellar export chaperone FlgN n=1 Tax=Undibacterium sp. TaxID=1914977 RepID=UPI002CA280D3|nr:flagellar export chaperone FlgN [Undibacterium sp.]HTD04157.1 flagellar export chaperone FlgN [Undibacterium sp.]